MELSLEQKKALALAKARKRHQEDKNVSPVKDAGKAFINSAVRAIPNMANMAGSGINVGLDYMLDRDGVGFQEYMKRGDKLTDMLTQTNEYEPKTTAGRYAGAAGYGLGGGILFGPAGAAAGAVGGVTSEGGGDIAAHTLGEAYRPYGQIAGGLYGGIRADKAARAFGRGVRGNVSAPKTADQLDDAYKAGRDTLRNMEVPAEEVKANLIEPIKEALKNEYKDADIVEKLKELDTFGRKGVNANVIEGFRQSLGNIKSGLTHVVRDKIDDFYKTLDVSPEFRGNYALKRRGETLNEALDMAGDSLTKQRNAVNKFAVKQKGLTEAERKLLKGAGKASLGEKTLLKAAGLTGPFASTGAAVATQNPLFIGVGAVGQGLRAGANAMGTSRIQAAKEAVEAGGVPLSRMENWGMLMRHALEKGK